VSKAGRRLALLVPLLLVGAGAGPADPTGRIVGAALTDSKAYETLAHLTDRIGPRLSGSAGLVKAVEWTASELRRWGLDRVRTEAVAVPHWVRGVESGAIVSPVEHPLAITALGMSVGTPPAGITGEVFEVKSFEEVWNAGAAIKGKIVLYNKPIRAGFSEPDGYGSVSKLRHKGAVVAARQGAIGMLIRSLGTASFRLPHTGAMEYKEGVPKIPAAAISAEDADLLHRLLASGDPVRVRLTLRCKTLPDAKSANVLAELPGEERADETVVIAAHLDSWDLATGAIDDGAGVAIVMDTMRVLHDLGLRPRRTIRAVLYTNEENGLAGGKAYAKVHEAELPKHVAAIETDSGAGTPIGFGVTAGAGAIEVVRGIAARLESIGAGDVTDSGGGADIGPMATERVPRLSLRQDAAL
jgi:hypothetical protein